MKKVLRIVVAALLLSCSSTDVLAAKNSLFKVLAGDPLVFLQKNKKAAFEIDYSEMMLTNV